MHPSHLRQEWATHSQHKGQTEMARTTRVVLMCDLRHSTEVEATGTAVITLNGDRYEIDVCDKHAAELVAKARKSRRPSGRTPAKTRTAAKKSPTRRRTSNKAP